MDSAPELCVSGQARSVWIGRGLPLSQVRTICSSLTFTLLPTHPWASPPSLTPETCGHGCRKYGSSKSCSRPMIPVSSCPLAYSILLLVKSLPTNSCVRRERERALDNQVMVGALPGAAGPSDA